MIPEQTEQECQIVQRIARETAEMFETVANNGEKVVKNLLELKFERYREYIAKDLVRVNDEWVPREQAVQLGLSFHDPVKWMESRSMGLSTI